MFDWLRRRLDRAVEMGSGEIEFLGPQSGADESRLQRALAKALASHGVQRGYLVRVRYSPDAPVNVALCLVGDESEPVLDEVQKIFWATFPTSQHLDILFVTADEEHRLAQRCEPFYAPRT